jgi:hypothetical protein
VEPSPMPKSVKFYENTKSAFKPPQYLLSLSYL